MQALLAAALYGTLSFGFQMPAGRGSAPGSPGRGVDLQARPPAIEQLGGPSQRAQVPATAACLADVCQPIVAVPGFDPQYVRPSRTELFADMLERWHVEPLASIVSAFVASGIRLEYTPGFVAAAGGPARARWGNLSVGLKVPLSPLNRPIFGRRSAQR